MSNPLTDAIRKHNDLFEHFLDEQSEGRKTMFWVSDGFTWRCSECGKTYWGRLAQPWNYCPNCGAKVEEKK